MAEWLYGDRIAREGKVVVGCSAIVFDGGREKILLMRRTDNGKWSLPGGALEAGESVTEACLREVKEETGLDVEIKRFVGIHSDPNRLLVYPDGNKYHLISLAFELAVVGGELQTNDEASDFRWAAADELEELGVVPPQIERVQDVLTGDIVIK